jgi:AraC family ethanolamine operon transcriptional activator
MQARFGEFEAINAAIPDFDSQYVRLRKGPVDTQLTRVALDRLVLIRCDEHVPAYVFRATAPPAPSLAFPLDTNPAAVWGGTPTDVTTLIHYAPGAEVVGRSNGSMTWVSIMFEQEDFDRHAARLGVEFRPYPMAAQLLSPHPVAMAELRTAVRHLFAIADSSHAVLDIPEVRRFQEESLLTAAVHAAQSADEPSHQAVISHRRAVMRALAVLEARCDEPVYLAELCEAAGVSERTLRTAFQRIHGVSPIRYLHLHRMGQARRALLRADSVKDRVSEIATRFGFANLGRFAVEFRQLFGESPSELLRARR